MSEFFLELFSEEIPVSLQKSLRQGLLENIDKILIDKSLKSKKKFSISTPNRMVIVFQGLDKSVKIKSEEIKGPSTNSPPQALEGFLKSQKINKKDIYKKKIKIQSFQETIFNLQKFWSKQGCIILQPYDLEVGAGTFHPATTLRSLGPKPWKAAYVQPSRRPSDGRYGDNPNRLQHYYQFQVIIKPSIDNIKKIYLNSLSEIGINHLNHDIRFVEDDWESPTLGAAGLGWEVWCDGMEISQFTYFQQMAGFECKPISVEITYGLERICMFTQQKKKCL